MGTRALLAFVALLLAHPLFAAHSLLFEGNVLAETLFGNGCKASATLVSPAAVELDVAIVAESLGAIERRTLARELGVNASIEATYAPLAALLQQANDDWTICSARAFMVPKTDDVTPWFAQFLQRTYGAEILPQKEVHGVEAWFRASLDGRMDDFTISQDAAQSGLYHFYDLAYMRFRWPEKGDVHDVAASETSLCTLLRTPLAGGVFLYIVTPKDQSRSNNFKRALSGDPVDGINATLAAFKGEGVWEGRAKVSLPKIGGRAHTDFTRILPVLKVPTRTLVRAAGNLTARAYVQELCVEIEEGPQRAAGDAKRAERDIAFDRPFVYFIHHPESNAILVAGVLGKEE